MTVREKGDDGSFGTIRYERDMCMKLFERWSEPEQVHFVEQLLARMCHYQHGHINAYLKPMLQRDFISLLPSKILKTKVTKNGFLFYLHKFFVIQKKDWTTLRKVFFRTWTPIRYAPLNWCARNGTEWLARVCCGRSWSSVKYEQIPFGEASPRGEDGKFHITRFKCQIEGKKKLIHQLFPLSG